MRKLIASNFLILAVSCGVLGWYSDTAKAAESSEAKPDKTNEAVPKAPRTESDLTGYIDNELQKTWKRDGITPAKQSDDSEFLRRVYLDTVGVPPTYSEVTGFLADKSDDKRQKLIDRLVNDRRFGEHMSNHWSHTLVTRSAQAISGNALFAQWMADEFNKNKGFDRTIRQIVTAKGRAIDNPAIVPWFKDGEAVRIGDMIGKISKSLMGVQVQCAQCHDHPYEESLTQQSFRGLAAFLSATKAGVDNGVQPPRAYVTGDAKQPKRIMQAFAKMDKLTAEQRELAKEYINYVRPVTLDGTVIDRENPLLWRAKLSAWMLSKKNSRTSRYVANRTWSIAFGIGIVNPVDDFNAFSEPSHPDLLNTLASDLIANSWDIKRLYRAILNTRAYQLSSKSAPKNAEAWQFASYQVRQLTPEQFIASLLKLMSDKNVDKVVKSSRDVPLSQYKTRLVRQKKAQDSGKLRPNQRRYIYDLKSLDMYAKEFGKIDNRWWVARWAAGNYTSTTTDDEMNQTESFVLSIDQALTVMNGDFTNGLSANADGSLLNSISKTFTDRKDKIDAVYLVVLGRRPTAVEKKLADSYMDGADNESQAAEDLLYAILMTTEFATNH